MEKDYNDWNNLKKTIAKVNRTFFDKGEVWFATLGKNIGDEEDGKNINFERPILILRKFNNNIFIAVPLTSQNKDGKYYKKIVSFDSTVILSQVRLLDSKRLLRKIGKVEAVELKEIKKLVGKII